MSSPVMRAKMRCANVEPCGDGEVLKFHAVAKNAAYPEDGSDEDNSYARFSPSADLSINVQNPNLKGKIVAGDTFYVDFTRVEQPAAVAS